MPNGKPGDHPITDIMVHHLSVYGDPLDTELRELGALEQRHWTTPKEQLQPIIAAKLKELRRDAKNRGWENHL